MKNFQKKPINKAAKSCSLVSLIPMVLIHGYLAIENGFNYSLIHILALVFGLFMQYAVVFVISSLLLWVLNPLYQRVSKVISFFVFSFIGAAILNIPFYFVNSVLSSAFEGELLYSIRSFFIVGAIGACCAAAAWYKLGENNEK